MFGLLVVWVISLGSGFDELSDDRLVFHHAGIVQSRFAVIVFRVDIGSLLE